MNIQQLIDPVYLILGSAFVSVLALVLWLISVFTDRSESDLEARLTAFTGRTTTTRTEVANAILRDGLTTAQSMLGRLLQRFENLPLLFRQADSPLRIEQFIVLCIVLCAAVFILLFALQFTVPTLVGGAGTAFLLPWIWLLMRRRSRLKSFEKQLPDALELLSRALRAGNSLAAGLNAVASEMPQPIAGEFRAVHDEQNLGLPIDQALRNMLQRVPNMDLQFFVTAVNIQRQAGGDLAEILGKISSLVRERFKILGQVRALTGEGRMSGVVLMGLPIVLFMAVYVLNRDYIMMLFHEEIGRQMLYAAIGAQFVGGYVIHRIVNIRV
ncbi:MAG: type II secretion system F family protein [Planctomyces sp.]|jgi:tight adherence protein B|nr:type II secretion system F family protein [Planctomyces sp.]GDX93075.1 secretion protein [Planctomycetia bacterium]